MWKWTEQHDTAFEALIYRVKVDGYIIGSMTQTEAGWDWEVGFPLLKMPDGCIGTVATKDDARQAIERKFEELTSGMSKDAAYDRMMKGVRAKRPQR